MVICGQRSETNGLKMFTLLLLLLLVVAVVVAAVSVVVVDVVVAVHVAGVFGACCIRLFSLGYSLWSVA